MPIAASVIIPAHDAATFLAEAIASSLAQTLDAIEVIVIDDGSTDATWDVITAAAAADRRIRPLRRASAGGPSAARNAGLALAKGRWIAPLDADDLLAPDRLRSLVTQAEARGADLVADNPERRDYHSGRVLGRLLPPPLPQAPLGPLDLVRGDMPDQPPEGKLGYLKPLIRREFLDRHKLRYAEDIRVGEDFLLLFACLVQGAEQGDAHQDAHLGAGLHLLPEPGYIYRIRSGSLSAPGDGALHLAAANRHMQAMAPVGDAPLLALLHKRQQLLDLDAFAQAIASGAPAAALHHVVWGSPGLALRQARIAAGALRQRLSPAPR